MTAKQQIKPISNTFHNLNKKKVIRKSDLPSRKRYSVYRSLNDFLKQYQIGTVNEYGKYQIGGIRIC